MTTQDNAASHVSSGTLQQKLARLLAIPCQTLSSFLLNILSLLPGELTFSIETAGSLPGPVAERCFRLVESNLRRQYEQAPSFGWDEPSKRAEMAESPTRFLLLHDKESVLAAFLSLQITEEEEEIVLYCYEVQVACAWQGQRLGHFLMDAFHRLAEQLGMTRTMLTCFTSNTRALAFYHRLGYTLDAASPQPRKLRRGTIQPDYCILTRPVQQATKS